MPYREDDWTRTPADAATFEQHRGQAYDDDSRPDAAEIRRDMAGLSDGTEHDCAHPCLVCKLENVLRKLRREAFATAASLIYDAAAGGR